MNNSYSQIIMNPIRQRILQYLIINKKGTASQISALLSDIPMSSLYRHIKILFDAGCIQVASEKSKRGATEKTYALSEKFMNTANADNNSASQIIQSTLMSVMCSFSSYFSNSQSNPQEDLLCLSSTVLMLSDEEMINVIKEIGEIFNNNLKNKPQENRKARNILFISAPPQCTK